MFWFKLGFYCPGVKTIFLSVFHMSVNEINIWIAKDKSDQSLRHVSHGLPVYVAVLEFCFDFGSFSDA